MNAPGAGFDALTRDIESLEAVVAHWDEVPRQVVATLRRAVDDLHREAFARLIRIVRTDPAGAAALKLAASDDVVYGVLRYLELVRPSMTERVEKALVSVRPMLAQHSGDVELVRLVPPDAVELRLLGSCDGCPASFLTLKAGIESAIRAECPEIVHVRQVKGHGAGKANRGFVSPFARAEDTGWIDSGVPADAIPEGGIRVGLVAGRAVIFSRLGDKVSCFDNACAHLGRPLDGGMISEGILTCPHHGFQYVLETGECLSAPEVQLLPHAVRVVGDRVDVKLSM